MKIFENHNFQCLVSARSLKSKIDTNLVRRVGIRICQNGKFAIFAVNGFVYMIVK